MEQAEREVARAEGDVTRLTTALEDPALYTAADGASRAVALGRDLDRAKDVLDRARAAWSEASERAEALVSGTA